MGSASRYVGHNFPRGTDNIQVRLCLKQVEGLVQHRTLQMEAARDHVECILRRHKRQIKLVRTLLEKRQRQAVNAARFWSQMEQGMKLKVEAEERSVLKASPLTGPVVPVRHQRPPLACEPQTSGKQDAFSVASDASSALLIKAPRSKPVPRKSAARQRFHSVTRARAVCSPLAHKHPGLRSPQQGKQRTAGSSGPAVRHGYKSRSSGFALGAKRGQEGEAAALAAVSDDEDDGEPDCLFE